MTKDMTQGSPLRLILAFAVPLMLGSLFQQFYNLADTIIVGRFVGVDALAAVGSVGGLNYLVLGFVNGIACGFSIPISWTFGAKDYSEMRRYTANTVWLSLFFAAVLTVVTVALTRAVLVWTNTPDNIIDIADIYIRTIFWGIPFTLLYNVTSALMRALGDSKRPLYFLLVASVLNIGLDLLFVLVFRWGIQGAALATVIGQICAAVIVSVGAVCKPPELRHMRRFINRIYFFGYSSILMQLLYTVYILALNIILAGFSDAAVTVLGLYYKLQSFFFIPLFGLQTCIVPVLSFNFAKGDGQRCRQTMNLSFLISSVFILLGIVCFVSFPVPMIRLFSDSSQVIEIGKIAFPIIGFRGIRNHHAHLLSGDRQGRAEHVPFPSPSDILPYPDILGILARRAQLHMARFSAVRDDLGCRGACHVPCGVEKME